jgi:hypothetical protein
MSNPPKTEPTTQQARDPGETVRHWVADAHQQYATLEAQWVTQAQKAVASWAQLTSDAILYSVELSAHARRLALDVARKASAPAGS